MISVNRVSYGHAILDPLKPIKIEDARTPKIEPPITVSQAPVVNTPVGDVFVQTTKEIVRQTASTFTAFSLGAVALRMSQLLMEMKQLKVTPHA